MENLKFNIGNNPLLSEVVQTVLFEWGYVWGNGSKGVVSTGCSYLFTYREGNITRTDDREHFASHPNKEFDLREIKEIYH